MARDEYLNSLYSLEGQVAVVTGGTGLLGGAMAMALAMAGARVGILERRASVAEETAAAIQARGGEAIAIPADVLDRDSLSMARDKLLKHWGAVHALVNPEDTQRRFIDPARPRRAAGRAGQTQARTASRLASSRPGD